MFAELGRTLKDTLTYVLSHFRRGIQVSQEIFVKITDNMEQSCFRG